MQILNYSRKNQKGVQFFEKLENLMAAHNYTHSTINNENFPFLNQIPIFSYPKIQLEVAYKMTELHF
jgi:hypothetical protein